MRKLLIANRAEIACRIAATARRMGIATVAVYSDADRHASHVLACDEAMHLGPSAPAQSYLNVQALLAAAKRSGADALHPGYGFLSERADFAQACCEAGLVFVGPSVQAIAAMGNKSEAKARLQALGIPMVPGYHGEDQSLAALQAAAQRLGFPLLIKASAGGGGRGMRVVTRAEDFASALAGAQREAMASFGCDQVLLERLIQRPRHIEVQVFGDQHGQLIHLGERDCSVQRRHQKVLEESPAPGLSARDRAQLGAWAVQAAQCVDYVGAGTVEFICEPLALVAPADSSQASEDAGNVLQDSGLRAYFMEMNTRLQVEHPVTEAVTGLDLVEWQLRIADGERLPRAQGDIRLHGHAIEARICAEDPRHGCLPSTGTIQALRMPECSHFEPAAVRLDLGVRVADVVGAHYDSLLAKLIVWGEDRAQAIARMRSALAALQISGLANNVPLLQWIVCESPFAQAGTQPLALHTGLLQQAEDPLTGQIALPRARPLDLVLAASLRWWHDAVRESQRIDDAWGRGDGWCLHDQALRRLRWGLLGDGELPEQVWTSELAQDPRGGLRVCIQAQAPAEPGPQGLAHAASQPPWCTTLVCPQPPQPAQAHLVRIELEGGIWQAQVDRSPHPNGERFDVHVHGASAWLLAMDPLEQVEWHATSAGQIRAALPGKVLGVEVQPGQRVSKGDTLVRTEAMKMEHSLCAPFDGQVVQCHCASGDWVDGGALLVSLVGEDAACQAAGQSAGDAATGLAP